MRPMIPHHYQYATPICEVSLFHLGAFSLCEHLPRKEYRVPPRGYIQSLRAPLKFRVLPLNPQCPSLPLPLCAVKNILKNSPTFRPSLAVPNNYDVYNYCQQNVNHSPLPCPVGGFNSSTKASGSSPMFKGLTRAAASHARQAADTRRARSFTRILSVAFRGM